MKGGGVGDGVMIVRAAIDGEKDVMDADDEDSDPIVDAA
jgi:hypothetical protein